MSINSNLNDDENNSKEKLIEKLIEQVENNNLTQICQYKNVLLNAPVIDVHKFKTTSQSIQFMNIYIQYIKESQLLLDEQIHLMENINLSEQFNIILNMLMTNAEQLQSHRLNLLLQIMNEFVKQDNLQELLCILPIYLIVINDLKIAFMTNKCSKYLQKDELFGDINAFEKISQENQIESIRKAQLLLKEKNESSQGGT